MSLNYEPALVPLHISVKWLFAMLRRMAYLVSVTGRYYRVTSLIRNSPPPYDHRRALGVGLL